MKAHPQMILELAEKDPFVKLAVDRWKYGDISWEGAMMELVVLLLEVNSKLQTASGLKVEARTPSVVERSSVITGHLQGDPPFQVVSEQ